MAVIPRIIEGDWHSVELAIRRITQSLGPQAALTIAKLIISGTQAERLLATNAAGEVVSTQAATWILAGEGVDVVSNPDGTITVSAGGSGDGIEEVADTAGRLASGARVVYQQDVKQLFVRRQ